jgi:hypothetical protein
VEVAVTDLVMFARRSVAAENLTIPDRLDSPNSLMLQTIQNFNQ